LVVRRLTSVIAGLNWSEASRRLVGWLDPVAASPASPAETVAALDSLGPSLMPRTSRLAGVGMGLSVLGMRASASAAGRLTRAAVPADAPVRRQLAARALVYAGGTALATLPQRDGERLWMSSLRSAGLLLRASAAGEAIYELDRHVRQRYPTQRISRPLATGTALGGGWLWWASRRLQAQEAAVARWPLPQKTTLSASIGTSWVVTTVGTGLSRGFVITRGALESYFGPGPSKRVLAQLVNAGLWAAGAAALYNAAVAYVGRANERIEPAYATSPPSPLVSGSPQSLLPFADLGLQGRRYVSDVLTPELIQQVVGEAAAHPVRVYVGFNSEPLYSTGRAELALAELHRTGAFERSWLLLGAPTGTGWVDHTLIETAEFLTRGDIATCCIQYGRYPSFLSVQKVALGRRQFRLLLWGVKQRLAERPPERRPRVLVFGESLGAWASSDVVMFQGIEGFDHYGVDRALWVGLPWLAKWSRSGMTRGSSTLVPAGTVGVFDRHQQLAALDEEQRSRLRVVILSHDNDPIAVLGPDLLVQRPWWLADGRRGRGVPDSMRWRPLVTFVQTAMDAANAMVSVPGEFGSFGHDYRADMVRFVHDAYQLPQATGSQLERIEETLRSLELERAERIKAAHPQAAPPAPAYRADQAALAGVPLRARRTGGARWSRGRRALPAGR
jgi:uncharacterized membrane protein